MDDKQMANVKNTNDKNETLISFFNKINIKCNDFTELHGMIIERNILMNMDTYKNIKKIIPELKQILSSSYLTSLHQYAETKQKWPLLNLFRQILLSCNYKLTPKRISNGYTIDGKKKYKRMFVIEKMIVII